MINKIKNIVNTKAFHVIVLAVIILTLLFVLGVTILDYNENGEKNMPFNISKISIISTSEGKDKHTEGSKWSFDIDQNNDIYIYIEKNKNYEKEETIKSVRIDNFSVERNNENGEIKIYKPDSTIENQIFTNKEQNVENSIEYIGGTESKFKELKISNQGDILAFRTSFINIASYQSNEEEEIKHGELLKKTGLTMENLKSKLTFDLTINLDSGKSYKATYKIDIPAGDIFENSTASTEITDFKGVIFKRIKN